MRMRWLLCLSLCTLVIYLAGLAVLGQALALGTMSPNKPEKQDVEKLTPALELQIETKDLIKIGSVIEITGTLKNLTDQEVVITRPDRAAENFHVLMGPVGGSLEVVEHKGFYGFPIIETLRIEKSGGTVTRFTIYLSPDNDVLPNKPGEYQIKAVYENFKDRTANGKTKMYTGKIESKPAVIRVEN